jgi:hypothetical protein
MRLLVLLLFVFAASCSVQAQFAFELKVDYAMRVGNTDQFSVSGTILSGRIEKGKSYFLSDGTKMEISNIISSKTATSVPVAAISENVSLALMCKNFEPGRGDVIQAITTRTPMAGGLTKYNAKQLPEGVLTCRMNGRIYRAKMVSKPVYIRASNIMDLFFMAEDESVVWLQVNGFSDIKELPHRSNSDTSQRDLSLYCKVVYLPKGYRPTDMPNNYKAYEDMKGNAGIMITQINRYKKTLGLEFSGILRPNKRLMEDYPEGGLFYITEGRVDQIGWDEF